MLTLHHIASNFVEMLRPRFAVDENGSADLHRVSMGQRLHYRATLVTASLHT